MTSDVQVLKPNKELWQDVQDVLAKKLSHPSFQMFVRPTQLVELSDSRAVVGVNNEFMRGYVSSNLLTVINDALSLVIGHKVSATIVVEAGLEFDNYTPSIATIAATPEQDVANAQMPSSETASKRSQAKTAPLPVTDPSPTAREVVAQAPSSTYAFAQNRITSANLNPEYTFDTFVVGSHNRFVHSAALAVAEKPGQAYNPLFIYGGVGLGKTHLMQAIGHQILLMKPNIQVRYISCERFTNELINSIRDDRTLDFRKRYRQVDVLLMDDVQFIAGKDATQEEFFHTFNALRDSGKQIVLSCDRPPKSMATLEERLRSRFEWGLIADIQAPDFETRLAILRKKAELAGIPVPAEVLDYIATVFTTNIRELEGALIRTSAYARLTGSPLTMQTVSNILQPQTEAAPKRILTIEKVIDTVAAHYRVEVSDLKSTNRSKDLALPRHVAMYLARELMDMSFPRIGEFFGGRKHSSAISACNSIREQIPQNPDLAHAVAQIRRQLSA